MTIHDDIWSFWYSWPKCEWCEIEKATLFGSHGFFCERCHDAFFDQLRPYYQTHRDQYGAVLLGYFANVRAQIVARRQSRLTT